LKEKNQERKKQEEVHSSQKDNGYILQEVLSLVTLYIMKKFLLTYWLSTALLFAIFYWDLSPIAQFINGFQTDFTAFLTYLTLPNGMITGHHISINSNYELIIENACNGIIPYLFFLASILAFPSSIGHKIKWAIGGYIVITAINIFRIWVVTQVVLVKQSDFSLVHDYFGNAILIATSLILFILFIKTRKNIN